MSVPYYSENYVQGANTQHTCASCSAHTINNLCDGLTPFHCKHFLLAPLSMDMRKSSLSFYMTNLLLVKFNHFSHALMLCAYLQSCEAIQSQPQLPHHSRGIAPIHSCIHVHHFCGSSGNTNCPVHSKIPQFKHSVHPS